MQRKGCEVAELTDEQIKQEEKFMKGLPRINWGALLMPGIWGPAHGFWASILFYPLWLVADNLIYAAYVEPTFASIAIAVLIGVVTVAFTIGFALVCQPIAAHNAEAAGISRETYLKRERVWAVVCAILAVIAVAWATYYNINIREPW